MSNDFYSKPASPALPLATVRSAQFNTNNEAVEAGFDKLPTEDDVKRIQYGTDGSATAALYEVTVPYLVGGTYREGLEVTFKAIFENTGPANISVNGGTNEPIIDGTGAALVAGSIKAGQTISLIREPGAAGTGFQLLSTVLLQSDVAAAVAAAAASEASATDSANSATDSANSAASISDPRFDNRYSPKFATVAAMVSATPVALDGVSVTPVVGMVVAIDDYATGNRSGLMFGRIVAAATGTVDGGSYIDLASGLQFEQNFPRLITAKLFGATGLGVADETTKLQAFSDFFLDISGRDVRYRALIDPGTYKFTSLTIDDAGTETGGTNGRSVISGAGRINTQLVCTSATADAITLTAGRIDLSEFTLTSDGVNRAKAIGAGNGLVIDKNAGAPDTVTIAKFSLTNIQILEQPGHGFQGINPELMHLKGVTSESNGGDGFFLDGANGGSPLGIGNLLENTRARLNTGRGYTIDGVDYTTLINPQALNNDASSEIWSSGKGTIIINPDVESDTAASHAVGITLSGLRSKVLGGLVFGTTIGIDLNGDGESVDGTHFTNFSLAYDMTQAVDTTGATNYNVDIADADAALKVLKGVQPLSPHDGGVQIIGPYHETATSVGQVKEFTVTSDAAFPLGDDGEAGGGLVKVSAYYITLTSGATIQPPLITREGQEFDIIFKQDATGGRAVSFSGANWRSSFSNTGNTANTTSTVRFRRHFDSSDSSTRYIQIGAQMPWV